MCRSITSHWNRLFLSGAIALAFAVVLNSSVAPAAIIAYQGFEAAAGPDPVWNFTANPTTFNTDGDAVIGSSGARVWAAIEEFTGIIDNADSGNQFWGGQRLAQGGGDVDHSLTFDNLDVTGFFDRSLSFAYYTVGYDADDTIRYKIATTTDGTAPNLAAASEVALVKDTDAWTPVTQPLADTVTNVALQLINFQDGNEQAGWDSVEVAGTEIPEPSSTLLLVVVGVHCGVVRVRGKRD